MIKYSTNKGIGIIRLNHPEKRNALHPEHIVTMKKKLNELRDDDKVKGLILTGEGSSFCSGADLDYLNELKNYSPIKNEADSESLAKLFLTIYNFPKPVIAAVNGPAIAGGCGLASVCDFIIADKNNAKFGYTEIKIGFVPAIVSIFLIKKIGEGKARQLLMSGEIIDAKKAYKIGLVNLLAIDALKESISFTEKLVQNSDTSLRLTKQVINLVSNFNIEDAINYCIRINTISRSTEDFQEGLNIFLSKNKKLKNGK